MKSKKLLVFSALPFLCSCTFSSTGTFSWEKYKNTTASFSAQSSKFEKYSLQDISGKIADIESKLEAAISQGNYEKFVEYYNALDDYYVDIVDYYIISSTKYYADSSNEDMKKQSDSYYEQYNNLYTYFIDLEEDIYNSPNKTIKEDYFWGMTDQQIQARLEKNNESKIETEYEAYFKEITDAAEELYNKVRTGMISKDQYMSKGYDSFLAYIEKANELVGKTSYKNYLEYSYAHDYDRDYTYEDALNFTKYVKQYLVPIYLKGEEIETPKGIDKKLITAFENYNFCNSATDSAEMFAKYAEDLGGQYLTAYNNAWKNGYWCFSDSANSLATAYQWPIYNSNDAVLYFSKDYQKILTIIHEFGHYYGSTANNGAHKNDCMDMAETFSQGDEFTYLSFLLSQKEGTDEYATYEYFTDSYAYNNLYYLIQEAAITEIEIFAYSTPNMDRGVLKDGIEDILEQYFEYPREEYYFMIPCTTSPCYYISYATSMVEALQFLSYDYPTAKTMYTNLIEKATGSTTVDRWKSAGLASPFEEASVKNVADLYNGIIAKYNKD